jgi:hypothetical protein
MTATIMILALLVVALVALGVFATVKAVGAAKRGVERTVSQARRTVEDTTLRAKSFGQVGVQGELAQLRLSLRTSMRATQDALHAGVAQDASLQESIALFERLSAHGHELDDELKRLEREPDRAEVATRLPELKERIERIIHSADSLRWAARDRARRFADDDLETLNAEIDMEAGALRHWSTSGTGTESAPAGEHRGSAPGASRSGTGDTRSWSDDTAQTPAEPHRPEAITARDPHSRPVYPWEKTTRPETTN